MRRVLYLIFYILILNFIGCGRSKIEGPPGDTRDVSKFDGPYEYVKANEDGTIVIRKNGKEYTFEFLGLVKGPILTKKIRDFDLSVRKYLWLEYDENKISSRGNLQGYAYYAQVIFHDAQGNDTSHIYQMLNARWLGVGSEFVDDGQTHKHYEALLEEIVQEYKNVLLYRSRGGTQDYAPIFKGRSIADLESKLAEYEKLLVEYRVKKKDKGL